MTKAVFYCERHREPLKFFEQDRASLELDLETADSTCEEN